VLQHLRWGAVFLLSVPVMALLLVVGPWLLPEYRDPAPRRTDLASALLSLLAVLLVIWGVKASAQDGFGWLPGLAVGAGVAAAVSFARRQRRLVDPLIDLRLFQVPAFSASLVTYLLATLVAFGSYVFIGQYLQLVLGLSPLAAGLWTLPWSAGFIVGSMVAPALGRRVRPPWLMGTGLIVAALGLVALSRVADSGLTGIVVGTTIFSLGLAPVITLGTDLMVGSAPPERAGAAAAISETSSELGGALGIAILGSIGPRSIAGTWPAPASRGSPRRPAWRRGTRWEEPPPWPPTSRTSSARACFERRATPSRTPCRSPSRSARWSWGSPPSWRWWRFVTLARAETTRRHRRNGASSRTAPRPSCRWPRTGR
jgi:DHA2 family multidrug resistance protein-like MFS transporter